MFILKKLITPFLLPPGIFIIILMVVGYMALRKKHYRSGIGALSIVALLWMVSVAPFADFMMRSLESGLAIPDQPEGDVIIVLGGSVYGASPDLSGTGAPGPDTMQRMVTGARLQHALGIPIIISGGKVYKTSGSISKVTKRFLIDLGIPSQAVILENRSRDTYENALYSKAICDQKGFARPVLVTSAYHIKRSILSFKKVGLNPLPFPCAITTWPNKHYGWTSYLPRAGALATTSAALHEWIGLIYYNILYF
jgi:uncharacterized SAM-binding protein YcdF (DUF218 family)